jgi:hypothetical protein
MNKTNFKVLYPNELKIGPKNKMVFDDNILSIGGSDGLRPESESLLIQRLRIRPQSCVTKRTKLQQ